MHLNAFDIQHSTNWVQMNVKIFRRFMLCPLQEVASQVLEPEEVQVGYSSDASETSATSDTQISTIRKVGDLGDVDNVPPRPSSRKKVAYEACFCAMLRMVHMVHLWGTYRPLVLICL